MCSSGRVCNGCHINLGPSLMKIAKRRTCLISNAFEIVSLSAFVYVFASVFFLHLFLYHSVPHKLTPPSNESRNKGPCLISAPINIWNKRNSSSSHCRVLGARKYSNWRITGFDKICKMFKLVLCTKLKTPDEVLHPEDKLCNVPHCFSKSWILSRSFLSLIFEEAIL